MLFSISCVLIIKPRCSQAEVERHYSFLNLYWQEMAFSCFCHEIIHTGWILAFTNSSSRTPPLAMLTMDVWERKAAMTNYMNLLLSWQREWGRDGQVLKWSQTDYMGMEIRCNCFQIVGGGCWEEEEGLDDGC